MTVKTITITQRAYELLKARKREDESFTEFFVRTFEKDRDIMECYGSVVFSESDLERMETFRAASSKTSRHLAARVKK